MTIRSHRLRLGLTQEELARRAGLSVRALRDIEQSRVIRPRNSSFDKLLNVLELSDEDRSHLLGRDEADFSELTVGVLGPLTVSAGRVPVDLVSGPQQTLLGMLALHAGAVVSVDELAEVFWPNRAPHAWRNLIHVYVNRLRAALEPAREKRAPAQVIASASGGYRLDLPDHAIDLSRFYQLTDAAKQAGRDGAALSQYGHALACWRGPMLAGADDNLRQHPLALAATRRRLSATLVYANLALSVHEKVDAEPLLRALTVDQPLHEGLHAALMTTLGAGGDQVGALQLFVEFRQRLADELGVDPGPEVQAAHRRVLQGRTSLTAVRGPEAGSEVMAANQSPPNQLPSAGRDFVGRASAIAQLDAWLTESAPDRIVAITGGAGVGKTSLAVRWARQAAHEYPDGQLYINLNGQGDEQPPLPVLDVLSFLLRSLGTPAQSVPIGLDEAVAAYRSLTATRRMLVMLDNAYSSEQVRPLLPGGPDSLVIVTSRDRLSGLVAKDGARRLELDALEPAETVLLIGLLTGKESIRAEPEAAADLARLCAHLPLAVRIATASMADRRYRRLSQLVSDLSGDGWPDALEISDDPQARVRVAFDNSYNQVPASAQRMFRLMGLMPGADVDVATAQALAGHAREETREQLRLLTAAHLLEQSDAERFTFHDLLRRYAVEVGRRSADKSELDSARLRLNRHYLDTAYAASRLITPDSMQLPYPDESLPTFRDQAAALAWLDVERPNLLAAIRRAIEDDFPDLAWQLSDMLRGYFTMRRFMSDWLEVSEIGLAAARQQHSRTGEYASLIGMARAQWLLGKQEQAAAIATQTLELARAMQWHAGLALSLTSLGAIYGEWGQLQRAVGYLKAAYEVFQNHETEGFSPGNLLGNLGVACHDLGQFDEAIEFHNRSLAEHESTGALIGMASAYSNLASCYLGKGHMAEAAAFCHQSLAIHTRIGYEFGIATTSVDLARIELSFGNVTTAAAYASESLTAARRASAKSRTASAQSVMASIERSPELHEKALEEAAGIRYAETEALIAYARTLNGLGRPGDAMVYVDRAMRQSRDAEYRHLEGGAATTRAESLLALGQLDEAKSQAEAAVELHEACNSVRHMLRTLAVIETVGQTSR